MKLTKKEAQLFRLLDKKTKQKWKQFSKYYINDSKPFINKISRDYKEGNPYIPHYKNEGFPAHVLKMIKKIPKDKYDSAVCILRGALPYALLFEAYGLKVHYVICGRRNERITKDKFNLRFNRNVDKTLKEIKGKKILLIENNSYSGNTPCRTLLELKKAFNIRKPDLFLDYFVRPNIEIIPGIKPFWKNKKRKTKFGKIYEARSIKVSKSEKQKLIDEFLVRLR